ncbi:MAG: catalase [Clostridia bacterium]|nr:catalase [Clostridia bacterium]
MSALKHFKLITRHRHAVIRHGFKAGIFFQTLKHDLSKYSPTEFLAGAKHFKGNKSPNEGERALYGYSSAWLHHKGRNRHHFEYWNDYNPATKRVEPVKMPIKFVKEMFCDRVAASKIYKGKDYTDSHPLEYFTNGKETRKLNRAIHPETSDLIESWLTILANEGEEAAFKRVRETKEY